MIQRGIRLTVVLCLLCSFPVWPALSLQRKNKPDEAPRPMLIIRKLGVTGNYPYLGKKILRLSSLQSGEPFHPESIAENEKRIADFFENEGYTGTTVAISAKPDVKKPFVNIRIAIHKGKTYRLGKTEFIGNTFFSNAWLHNQLEGFGHFRLSRIKRKLKKIEQKYGNNGFVRARVKLISVETDEIKRRVNVVVEMIERKRLKINFDGNRWFSPQRLDDHVTFFTDRGYDRFEVERSEQGLIDFYRHNGFIDAGLEAEVTEPSENEIHVTFTISEGNRARLKKVVFDGATAFGEKALVSVMGNQPHTLARQGFFREDIVEEDVDRIAKYYHEHGWFDAKVTEWEIVANRFRDQMTMVVGIDEGTPYLLDNVLFKGNREFEASTLFRKSGLKLKKPLEADKVSRAQDKIIALYQEKGYAYVKINATTEPDREAGLRHAEVASATQAGAVSLTFAIDEGLKAQIGRIVINGQYATKEKVIRENLKIKSGDPYTYKKILDAQLNLKRLGIFDHVRILTPDVDKENAVVDLEVQVTERKSWTFDADAGFDSDKLASGQFLLTKQNIFGLAKQVQFRLVGGFEFDRGEATFYSPRVYGASWNLVNQYFVQYEDDEQFNAASFGGSVGVLKHFGPDWTVLMKMQANRMNIFEGESNTDALAENLFDSTFLENIFSVTYDTRDNFADPGRGFYALVSTEFDTDLADASNVFNIAKVNLAHYLHFLNRFTLVNAFRAGKLFRINPSARVPVTKLFFMGGNDTVRGFDEDAVDSGGGTTSVIYNAELHYRLFNNFKLAGFFDAGSLTETITGISRDSIRESAGVGLRYFTPVGPIRLDYGFVLDKKEGEKGQRFHFSFGYFF
ncbi:MAG: outer membrane protein assembly factor BamA [Deltaproteobacteria bacterium]|nr:outer membrane protein assembly factor BamA [Deltaproteobacteria bacterium]